MFTSEQKSYFYTHTGFGAIHHDAIYYSTPLNESLERLGSAESVLSQILETASDEIGKFPGLNKLEFIHEGIRNMSLWLKGFSEDGIVMLNYGEICSFIEPDSMKNEDSVGEIRQVIENLGSKDFSQAESNLKLLEYKWSDIASKASGEIESRSLQ